MELLMTEEALRYSPSPATHSKFPRAARGYALWMMMLGRALSARMGQNAGSFGDVWVDAVMPLLVSRTSRLPEPFAIGSRVELHSLSKAELNGREGAVLTPRHRRSGRMTVDLGDRKVTVKPANLKLAEVASTRDEIDTQALGETLQGLQLS